MSTQVVAKRYGQALFELAKEKDCLQSVQQDLQQILAVIADSTELQGVIANKLMQAEVKQRVFKQLFDNRINSISLNFLLLVLQKQRENALEQIAKQFNNLADQDAGIVKAKVKSAVRLEPDYLKKLQQALGQATKKQVELELELDRSIMGGIVVRIGDRIIDGSVAAKLKLLEKHLKSVEIV